MASMQRNSPIIQSRRKSKTNVHQRNNKVVYKKRNKKMISKADADELKISFRRIKHIFENQKKKLKFFC